MKIVQCKICKYDLPIENFSKRLSNGKYVRYGKTCDICRKKQNKLKFSSEDFKNKNRIRQNNYNYKRFFYARAVIIINRSKKSNSEHTFSLLELTRHLASLWRKQKGICDLSGDVLTRENAQVDHIIPKSIGGKDEFSNYRWITKECNIIKNGFTDEKLKEIITKILKYKFNN